VIERADEIPFGWRNAAVEESQRCRAALAAQDILYFVNNFVPKDRWRILAHYLEHTSFFDIETAGLEYADPITVIACWHKGEMRTFVEHENLDEFLTLLEHVKLLTSFNGASFDVPRVLDSFHIPELPCPHLDLRWLCYHQGLRGGLKEITCREGISRPRDLQHADGELAIRLWARWQHFNDAMAREQLIRYCASDVLLLLVLAQKLVGDSDLMGEEIWNQLPEATGLTPSSRPSAQLISTPGMFGEGSPSRLRACRQVALPDKKDNQRVVLAIHRDNSR